LFYSTLFMNSVVRMNGTKYHKKTTWMNE
jgi:hypothetical protein